jgi:hypothetical protein
MQMPRRAVFRTILGLALLFLCAGRSDGQARPDFSGVWKQDGAQSVPARTGDVTLRIVHRDPTLSIETTIVRAGRPTQHAVQVYSTDGQPSTSTGADGDSFVTRIVWSDDTLAFTIVEHEDGRVIDSTERWSLGDGGETLKRARHSLNSGDQTIVYRRVKT